MIFEFDKDFAKEAQETGLGRVITKNQREVILMKVPKLSLIIR